MAIAQGKRPREIMELCEAATASSFKGEAKAAAEGQGI
jgi:hypothetical protein